MSHPRRAHIHEATRGEQIADSVAAYIGSWRFIIIQSVIVACWITLNILALFKWHWDPFPFILLNLVFSTQAAYTGPLVMLSQNRQAAKDRKRDDTEAKEVQELFTMNRTQLKILKQQSEILELLKAVQDADTRRAPAQSAPALERPKALVVPQKGRVPSAPAKDAALS